MVNKLKIILVVSILSLILTESSLISKTDSIKKLSDEALTALQKSEFKKALKLSQNIVLEKPYHSKANVILAIVKYKKAMHNLSSDFRVFIRSLGEDRINKRFFRFSLESVETKLSEVETHLSRAAKDSGFSMDINLSKWNVDWNRNGRIDKRDKLLFQIEMDKDGKPFPKDDPRRTPTFRFDYGDIYWARAMIAFQRVFFNVLLAYHFPDITIGELEAKLTGRVKGIDRKLILKMKHKKYIVTAKMLLLNGLNYAERSRIEYLKEKDDEREWLPNPGQKNHPMPLPVNEELYTTWKNVIYDLKNLVEGKEGISVKEAAQFGDHKWKNPPEGYINVGMLLDNPGDLVFDLANIDSFADKKTKKGSEQILKDIFGNKYQKNMKASPLLSRFKKLKNEVEKGEESLERKLRYLFWLN